jgi:hypothetical protein
MTGLHGVDVSSYNGTPGQWKPLAGNIAFGAVKISELAATGPYVNPVAAADWAALEAMKAGRVAYLFGHPAMGAAATVNLFLDTLRHLGIANGDMVALDLEVSDGLGPAAVAAWAGDVLGLLKRELDRAPLLYTFISFAQEGNCAGLGHYPLWIAEPSSPPGKPFVPPPWRTHAIHQYSLTAPLDRDLANYASLKAMRAALGKHVPAPAPKPRRHEPVQLPQVLSYVTISIPAGVGHVLLSAGANVAPLKYQFLPGGTWTPLTLVAQDGASVVAVPAKATQLRIQRSETAESIDVALQDS